MGIHGTSHRGLYFFLAALLVLSPVLPFVNRPGLAFAQEGAPWPESAAHATALRSEPARASREVAFPAAPPSPAGSELAGGEPVYSVLLDDSVEAGTFSTAALYLTIDLDGYTTADLDFWWREFEDEDQPEDGLFLSNDYGQTWHQAFSFNGGPLEYQHQTIDLAAAAGEHGLTLNDHFQFKFQFHGNNPIPVDGYAFDEIRVTATGPIAGLVASSDSPTAWGESTTLTATVATGSDVGYTWAFGDGEVGHGAVVTHTYPAVGLYTAVVTASNDYNSVTASTIVTVEEALAGLRAINDSPTPLGDSTKLMASVEAGTGLMTYTWAFGDGGTASGAVVSHVYPEVGPYTAVVTASNSVSVLEATTAVTVTDVPIAGLTATNDGPTPLGSPTTLTATVVAGTNVSYTWAFGDGETGRGAVATHTYAYAGVYTPVVTAGNSLGTMMATTPVTVVAVVPPSGGTVRLSEGITITIPGGTFTDTIVIFFSSLPVRDTRPLKHVGVFYRLMATYLSSGWPATLPPGRHYAISVAYRQDNVPSTIDEADLALYYLDGDGWAKEPTSVANGVANTVAAKPGHFSIWAVLAESRHQIWLPLILRNSGPWR